MNNENAIIVNNITKSFKVYPDKGNTFKERVLFRKRNRFELREVLKGISFEVKKGEAIGLIGANGCGKSTTLKLLTRIMYPDSGSIEMFGRVSSLIELGAGFHGDMSGRENIYINASIFGLTKKEIDERVDDIIAFSELGAFIDNPVRTYSSGMYMRLAFSVAINVDADILMIDEILAVGDQGFQNKCFNKLREIKASGTTIVIVSHSLGQIEQICDRSMWIHEGKVRAEGVPKEVHMKYLEFMGEERERIACEEEIRLRSKRGSTILENESAKASEEVTNADGDSEEELKDTERRWGNRFVRIREVRLLDGNGKKKHCFKTGENMRVEVDYRVVKPVEDAVFGIGIFRTDGVWVYGINTRIDHMDKFDIREDGTYAINLNNVPLLSGDYILDVSIEYGAALPVDYYKDVWRFQMMTPTEDVGVCKIEHDWEYPMLEDVNH